MSDLGVLETTGGDFPLEEVVLEVDGRTWAVLHTGAVTSKAEELAFLQGEQTTPRPYGLVLWPASIALAHELTGRELTGKRVLELGAGTGLPGIVAAARGAHVVQTDRQRLVLEVCKRNAERNGITAIEHRIADWTEWTDVAQYDVILGSDVLYATPLQPKLRHIFETNLAPGGTVLVSDPFRETTVRMLEQLESEGWRVRMDRWSVGIAPPPRPVAVFTLTRQ
jgi:predicted nicotinamide N-methyase